MFETKPLYTISSPSGEPYISVISEDSTIRLQLHSYDKEFTRPVFLHLDKRAIPELILILERVQNESN